VLMAHNLRASASISRHVYLASWIKALKGDAKLVIVAAVAAQKTTDYILNQQHSSRPHRNSRAPWLLNDSNLAAAAVIEYGAQGGGPDLLIFR
jgi:antirestriction protein ArdC